MRVMVIGATGFIGPPLVRRLEARGHAAVAVSRHGPVVADRDDPRALARLAAAARVDAVVDLLALTDAATRPLLEALIGRVGRYVLASSGDVYRQYGALHRKEPGGPPLARLGEDAPLRTRLYPYRAEPPRAADDPQAWMDDYDKIPIEQAVRGVLGDAGAVVRLPMVYGPGDRQRRFGWAIRPMTAGKPRLALDPRWAAWRTSYGYVDDVAEGLALAAVHPAAGGRTFNLGPEAAPDHAAWVARLAQATGWTGEVREEPSPALDGLDLTYPFEMDSGRIRRELGYREPTDADVALERTIADELAHVDII
jgi:nucleoside-diphosphate-sugar epimerase